MAVLNINMFVKLFICADRMKEVQLELNPDLADVALELAPEQDQPVILEKLGEGSVGVVPSDI